MDYGNFTHHLEICVQKTRRNIVVLEETFPRFPHVARDRGWDTSGDEEWKNLTDGYWTGGFWIGTLWMCYRITGDSYFRDNARRWALRLTPRCSSQLLHDVGFLFFPSAVIGCELCGQEDLRITAKRAAYTMVRLFDKGRGFIPLADKEQYRNVMAIDTMMNLPLLWWAGASADLDEATGIAMAHVAATERHLVREDGSTAHIARLGAEGQLLKRESWQGEGENTCWSRGQAWAIAGAAYALFFTGEKRHADLLDRLLKYYVDNVPEDGVPYWDFDAEDIPDTQRDSSAAAIVAHALMLLSTKPLEGSYATPAKVILESLAENYLTGIEHPGFLKKVCFHRPAMQDISCSSIFADFYFMMAMYLTTGEGRESLGKLGG